MVDGDGDGGVGRGVSAMSDTSGQYDLYVLASERTAALCASFLNEFAPQREQSADEYLFSDGHVEQLAAKAIEHCIADAAAEQAIYFRVLLGGTNHAMLFFNSDGSVVLGISVAHRAAEWFDKLAAFTGSAEGYMTVEEPPPHTASEFRKTVSRCSTWRTMLCG